MTNPNDGIVLNKIGVNIVSIIDTIVNIVNFLDAQESINGLCAVLTLCITNNSVNRHNINYDV